MINKLSRVTTYIETFAFNRETGELVKRSHATGFFVKCKNAILLVTNWHVVTGLDPANPSMNIGGFIPEVLKISVFSNENILTELSIPLYNSDLSPRWDEHPDRNAVDLIFLPLPNQLEDHYQFFDIASNMGNTQIEQAAGKDVFILGYPFSKEDMSLAFGAENFYYIPVWKRGSIATEPKLKLSKRLILIDSMSRPGMSGAPVVIAEDTNLMVAGSDKNAALFKRLQEGDSSALFDIDAEEISNKRVKNFNILGVYSGVIGTTKLQNLALGKCWHISVLNELIKDHKTGLMPHHAPMYPHKHYQKFLENISGVLIRKNPEGDEIDRIPMNVG